VSVEENVDFYDMFISDADVFLKGIESSATIFPLFVLDLLLGDDSGMYVRYVQHRAGDLGVPIRKGWEAGLCLNRLLSLV